MNLIDRLLLLSAGITAIYLLRHFYTRYQNEKALFDVYYLVGFGVLLLSGILLITFGWDILGSPYVLTAATLIPLGISMGLMNQFCPKYKRAYSWFALIGLLAIGITSIFDLALKTAAVPVFHGTAGLIIFGLPLIVKDAEPGFWLVAVGGASIGLGGIALAFLATGSQFLFFSEVFVFTVLAPLLLLMTLAFTFGFRKDIGSSQ